MSNGIFVISLAVIAALAPAFRSQEARTEESEFNDAHFHLTNYIQEGTPIRDFLKIMGNTTGRSVLFGIPLQQQWSYRISAENAPTYYLDTDAPLYYYSFTDAAIAMAYLSLSPEERARFDPLITGFNPTDMYAADHVRRVLRTFPGVFCGIGEFSIHKEFVSSKVAGDVASLFDPALDRLLAFAEEAGLVVIIHNDIDRPFADPEKQPAYLEPMKDLLRRHPGTTIIWAHTGMGRVIRPIKGHAQMLEDIINDPGMRHVMFDISWDEVAKYFVASPASLKVSSDLINRYPGRFLFGTDSVAPKDQAEYLKTYRLYDPLWSLLTKEASLKVRKDNYTRVFNAAATRVRAWEASQTQGSPVSAIR
ncbi:MAG TPA: amidohydrolase family protein [Terriglobia bacterium]|jgi:predicted TIM-barrel fold metal-dependent hydrolase